MPENCKDGVPAPLCQPEASGASAAPGTPQASTQARARRLARWQHSRRNQVRQCWDGTASPRRAIKVMCLECQGEDVAAVRECGDSCCPLWMYRPFQSKGGTEAEQNEEQNEEQ